MIKIYNGKKKNEVAAMFAEKTVVMCKPGLHNDKLTYFIQRANDFKSSIWIEAEERKINAKSLLGVMSMAIAAGTEIILSAEGPDEEEAVESLAAMLA